MIGRSSHNRIGSGRTWLILTCIIGMLWLTGGGCSRDARQGPQPFVEERAHEAIETLAQQLEENFIYPDVGAAYARALRAKLAAGAYSGFQTAADFAGAVTRDLQAVHREGHLRLIPPGETIATSPFADVPDVGKGVVRAGWVAPGVGYMSLHGFMGNHEEYTALLDRLRTVLEKLSGANTLIVDARYYVGGAPGETDLMASYFFDRRTTLLEFDTRQDVEERGLGVLEESERMIRVDAPDGIIRRRQIAIPVDEDLALKNAKIYVLTSEKTASGGEGFALTMKRTGRATLIGETTEGAGHFGRTTPLGGGYRAFIPIGRPFDPTTGKGWELTGVEPDVKTTADHALDEALRRAGVDPDDGRKAIDALALRSYTNDARRQFTPSMLSHKNFMQTRIIWMIFGGLFIGTIPALGQCRLTDAGQTDSSLVVEGPSYQGIVFTRNRTLGTMTDIRGNKTEVTIHNLAELPQAAEIMRPTLQEICAFETAFEFWWTHSPNRERIRLRSITIQKKAIHRFNRQYLGYRHNDKRYMQVTLFDPRLVAEKDWKAGPIACGHCWPDIFVLNYDLENQKVTLNTNFQ